MYDKRFSVKYAKHSVGGRGWTGSFSGARDFSKQKLRALPNCYKHRISTKLRVFRRFLDFFCWKKSQFSARALPSQLAQFGAKRVFRRILGFVSWKKMPEDSAKCDPLERQEAKPWRKSVRLCELLWNMPKKMQQGCFWYLIFIDAKSFLSNIIRLVFVNQTQCQAVESQRWP